MAPYISAGLLLLSALFTLKVYTSHRDVLSNLLKPLRSSVIPSPMLTYIDARGISGYPPPAAAAGRDPSVEEQLTAALEEKDALLHELYHRMNNNMQIIYSFLRHCPVHRGG